MDICRNTLFTHTLRLHLVVADFLLQTLIVCPTMFCCFCCVVIAGINPPYIIIKAATDTETANAMILITVSEDVIVD